eukprot:4239093-Prymnesium_polylepis.1
MLRKLQVRWGRVRARQGWHLALRLPLSRESRQGGGLVEHGVTSSINVVDGVQRRSDGDAG